MPKNALFLLKYRKIRRALMAPLTEPLHPESGGSAKMLRKIGQKTIVRELSISFLQAYGGRNKALE